MAAAESPSKINLSAKREKLFRMFITNLRLVSSRYTSGEFMLPYSNRSIKLVYNISDSILPILPA